MPNPVASLIQLLMSGQNTSTGLGTNPPGALGVNPVRDLPVPGAGVGGGAYAPPGGGSDPTQILAQFLPMLMSFIQGNVSISPAGGSVSGTSPSGAGIQGSGDLTQLIRLLLGAEGGAA